MKIDDHNPEDSQDPIHAQPEEKLKSSPSFEIANQEKINDASASPQSDKKLPHFLKKKETKSEVSVVNTNVSHTTSLSRKELATAFLVFVISLFVIFLHLNSRENWNREKQQIQESAQLVLDSAQKMIARGEIQRLEDSLRVRAFKMNYFDAYDETRFRIYGLFRDKSRKLTINEVAKKFNISSVSAIKKSEVNEESWFIVPVKAVHFVKKGETSQTIAKKYYLNIKAYPIIESFNYHKIKAGKMIFIPFD